MKPASAPAATGGRATLLVRVAQRLTPWAVLVALLVVSPTLLYGVHVDDHLQRGVALGRLAMAAKAPFQLFTFFSGEPGVTRAMLDQGLGAWWSDPGARVVFLRPISSFLMWVDYRFVQIPALIHLHSLVWFAAAVALARGLYRRLLPGAEAAALATMFFALDPTHGLPIGWIAQRNTLIAAVFGMVALTAYDRARREGGAAWLALSSCALGASLLSAEAGLGTAAYLFAYAVCLDGRRLRPLLAFAPPLALWAIVYVTGRYGAHGSALYVDLRAHPQELLLRIPSHVPMLLATELGLVGVDVYILLPTSLKVALVLLSLLFSAAFVRALLPLLRSDKTVRFFLLGALLSMLPLCAVFPGGRVLMFPSIGLVGALGRLLAEASPARDLATRGIRALTAGFHGWLAPVLLLAATTQMIVVERQLVRCADGLPVGADMPGRRVVAVNPPDATFIGYLPLIQRDRELPAPASIVSITSGARPYTLTRLDDRTLRAESEVGLVRPGSDLLAREDRPFAVGERFELTDLVITIEAIDGDGWPTSARYAFAHPLEDARELFMEWDGRTMQPFALPAEGERRVIPARSIVPF